jgi:Tat protein secretion system quality control protein TatD with DNase activity
MVLPLTCRLTGTPWLRLQFCKREVQLRGFERQFELVRRSGLPAFLHSRAAAPDMLAALRRHAADMRAGGVVHSFDGSAEEAASLLELPNIYLGTGHAPANRTHTFYHTNSLMLSAHVQG